MTIPISAGTPLSATLTAGAAPSITKAGSTDLGKDTFLKLLVAQLRYQDPMNPADGTAFLAQTAQFSTVEKLSEIATQNESMIQAQNLLGASALVGKTVTYLTGDGQTTTGAVTSVRLDPKGATVRVGGADVPVARLTEIRETTTTPTSTTPAVPGVGADTATH